MAITRGNKNKKIQASEAASTLEAVKGLDLTSVIGEVGNLQVSVQGTLSNLTSALAGKIQQMETVDLAIGLKESRLQELFDIEKEAITIDDLRAQREVDLATWERSCAERNARWSEEEIDRKKFLKREAEEYLYSTNQNQKRIGDEFDAQTSHARRDEEIRIEGLEREWEQREVAISEQEAAVVLLRAQVAEVEPRIKAEVAKAEAIVGNTLKRQHEHEMALVKKDIEIERKMTSAQEAMQRSALAGLKEQIGDLQSQLAAARADAKEIASQALLSTSGRQSLEAVQRFAETRENAPKTK